MSDEENAWWADASRRDTVPWSDVRGAAGWWTTLMSGVWVNGVAIMKNQPVFFELQIPFILGPERATRRFYHSISGAKQLQRPYDRFYAFPCHNSPNIASEFDGWLFPSLSGSISTEEAWAGPPGGLLSLGKIGEGSGLCLGAVVAARFESDAGQSMRRENTSEQGSSGSKDPNGLEHTWIMGEPSFRKLRDFFDSDENSIGFRSY